MTNLREAAQQALDAETIEDIHHAKKALRAALATEQEPVAWIKARELTYMKAVVEHGATYWKTNLGLKPEDDDAPLYIAPPQREWKGLTAKDLAEIPASCFEGAIWADAKLKEKNSAFDK